MMNLGLGCKILDWDEIHHDFSGLAVGHWGTARGLLQFFFGSKRVKWNFGDVK